MCMDTLESGILYRIGFEELVPLETDCCTEYFIELGQSGPGRKQALVLVRKESEASKSAAKLTSCEGLSSEDRLEDFMSVAVAPNGCGLVLSEREPTTNMVIARVNTQAGPGGIGYVFSKTAKVLAVGEYAYGDAGEAGWGLDYLLLLGWDSIVGVRDSLGDSRSEVYFLQWLGTGFHKFTLAMGAAYGLKEGLLSLRENFILAIPPERLSL